MSKILSSTALTASLIDPIELVLDRMPGAARGISNGVSLRVTSVVRECGQDDKRWKNIDKIN